MIVQVLERREIKGAQGDIVRYNRMKLERQIRQIIRQCFLLTKNCRIS